MDYEEDMEIFEKDISDLNKITAELTRLAEQANNSYRKRLKKQGPKKAVSGIWRDNPDGTKNFKAEAAGLAAAYEDVTGNKGNGIDEIAKAIGIANAAKDTALSTSSPGDRGRTLRRYMDETKMSKNPKVKHAFNRARKGDVIFEKPAKRASHVGLFGPLRHKIIGPSRKAPAKKRLQAAIAKAQKTKAKSDIDDAVKKLLDAAEALGQGRYLFAQRRQPKSRTKS